MFFFHRNTIQHPGENVPYEEQVDGVNLLSVSELQKYTLIKIFNFSIILLSFLYHVKIL